MNEGDVADEAHVGALEAAAEYAVVKAGHEEQSGRARLGHAHEADERAEKAVEEEVEVVHQVV